MIRYVDNRFRGTSCERRGRRARRGGLTTQTRTEVRGTRPGHTSWAHGHKILHAKFGERQVTIPLRGIKTCRNVNSDGGSRGLPSYNNCQDREGLDLRDKTVGKGFPTAHAIEEYPVCRWQVSQLRIQTRGRRGSAAADRPHKPGPRSGAHVRGTRPGHTSGHTQAIRPMVF